MESITSFSDLATRAHNTAVEKGFWSRSDELVQLVETQAPHLSQEVRNLIFSQKIALMHSELGEALEGFRHGNPPSDKIPEFSAGEEELADLVIRCMDTAKKFGWDLEAAIRCKMAYNSGRPYMHGKQF